MQAIWYLKFLKHDKIWGTICMNIPNPNSGPVSPVIYDPASIVDGLILV